jgi:hypothetical protein
MTGFWATAPGVLGWRRAQARAALQRAQADAATPEVLAEAVGWLQDCFDDVPEHLHPVDVVRAVWRHWDAGDTPDVWADFVRCVG